MGADIHPFLELKIGGKWTFIGQVIHWRNYETFSELSGVRGSPKDEDDEYIGDYFDSRDDMINHYSDLTSPVLKMSDCDDYHSYTVVTPQILKELPVERRVGFVADWRKLFGKLLKAKSIVEDARIVMWYDN